MRTVVIAAVALGVFGCSLVLADQGDVRVLTEDQMASVSGQCFPGWFGTCTLWAKCKLCVVHVDCMPTLWRCDWWGGWHYCTNFEVTKIKCTGKYWEFANCTGTFDPYECPTEGTACIP